MALTAVVVMGVSGSGKSTVAEALAKRLDWPFADGDHFHSAANVAKMAHGHPLTDEDRAPWIASIRDWIADAFQAGQNTVVACSALRRAYRDVLRQAANGIPDATVRFAFLDVGHDILRARMIARHGHFMHAEMLASQLQTLEPPAPDEHAITVSVSQETTPEHVVDLIVAALGEAGALPAGNPPNGPMA
jgi:gluconokinase